MSNESLRRSMPANSPVDPLTVRVLRALDRVAGAVGCSYFVAGATARDLILVSVHGLRPGRATRDIDFGLAVESWDGFAILKERLVVTGDFTSDRKVPQRLIYLDSESGMSLPIDLIPFRGAASADGTIAWPPKGDVVMNVAGFEEALTSAISLKLAEDLVVRVASIPGLTLLKLVAWSDRGRETNKDAADIYQLLGAYGDAGNTDRLYDHEMDLLEALGFDMRLAGAELLGRDVANLCSPAAFGLVQSVLQPEHSFERLLGQMMQTSEVAEAAPFVERMLNAFRRGFGTPL